MKVILLFFVFIIVIEFGCDSGGNCVDGLDKMPMYGGVRKCNEQIEADKAFIAMSDNTYKGRKNAAANALIRG